MAAARGAELLVTNPPWGKNLVGKDGSQTDGAAIVQQLAAQHPTATMCFIVSSHALAALRAVPGLQVRRSVRLGGIEVVTCRAVTNSVFG